MKSFLTPYRLTPDIVRKVVDPGWPGSYALGNDEEGFVGKYIGRSDTCLMTRLATHDRLYRYDYFIHRYAEDEVVAFRQECEWWHIFQQKGHPVANLIHPASPGGSGLECPYCHFGRHASTLLAA